MTRKELCARCLKHSIEVYSLVNRDEYTYAPWPTAAIRLAECQVDVGNCYRTGTPEIPNSCEYHLELLMTDEQIHADL
jgi:hypothetical protein